MSTPTGVAPRRCVYDANVLYPAPLRDILVRLAMTHALRAHWTERIHDEWTRNLLENRPDLRPAQLARTRRLMNEAVPGALVTSYERRVSGLTLPDPNDRHVLAAAIEAGAGWIVTFNERDFPSEALRPHGIQAAGPDRFAAELLEAFPEEVVGAARRHRRALTAPPKSVEEYLATFERQRLKRTAAALRTYREEL